jgi:hypothetical protein
MKVCIVSEDSAKYFDFALGNIRRTAFGCRRRRKVRTRCCHAIHGHDWLMPRCHDGKAKTFETGTNCLGPGNSRYFLQSVLPSDGGSPEGLGKRRRCAVVSS